MVKFTVKPGIDIKNLESSMIKAWRKGLAEVARGAHKAWEEAAGQNLHRLERDYVKSLKISPVDEDTYEIVLHNDDTKLNWILTAVEVGVPAYTTVKPGLLKSEAASHWSQYAKGKAGKPKVGAPFVDVPFFKGRGAGKPYQFRRVSPKSEASWKHPGFKPTGGGGLTTPLRERAIKFVIDEAPNIMGPLFKALKV